MFIVAGGGRNPKTIKVYDIIIYNSNTLSLEQLPLDQDIHQVELTNIAIPLN